MSDAHKIDAYGSVWPQSAYWSDSADVFATQLIDATEQWIAAGHKRIWLKLTHAQSALIPAAIAQGFTFHQVHNDELLLIKRLVPAAIVPHQASHHVGAGGVVINAHNELLVIAERTGSKVGTYKIPGGYVEQGEHIHSAIEREIREETGVQATFQTVVLVRHLHKTLYGKSNLYFVCRLRPLTTEIIIDPVEIAECRWMPIDTFLAHPRTQSFHKAIVQVALQAEGLQFGRLPNHDYDAERAEFLLPLNNHGTF